MMERLLLLDADVTIHFHTYDLWNGVVKSYEACLASTVANREVNRYPDQNRRIMPLDLKPQIKQGIIKIVSALPQELKTIIDKLKPSKINLDPCELESMAIIDGNKIEGLKFCVIDKAAIMALSYLGLDDKAISCEDVLINCGILQRGKTLPHQDFAKKRFDYWVTQGKFKLLANLDTGVK